MSEASVDGPASFYFRIGPHEFESTTATASPWDDRLQHGGPPSALLASAIEGFDPRPELVTARISIDFLGPLPQGRLRTAVRTVRAGRRIDLVEASLDATGQPVAVARAWRVKASADGPTATVTTPPAPLPPPQAQQFFAGAGPAWGYGRAIEWRFVRGGYRELGPAQVWARTRIPLIAGESTSGLQRMLVVADSLNGLSAVLDMQAWLFVPPAITVTVHRVDAGPWLLLEGTTVIDASGVGMAHGTMSDERGPLGVVTQPLLIERR